MISWAQMNKPRLNYTKRSPSLKVGDASRRLGEVNGRAKLTEASVKLIRLRSLAGLKPAALAMLSGVSRQSIENVLSGKTWGHVK